MSGHVTLYFGSHLQTDNFNLKMLGGQSRPEFMAQSFPGS